MTALPVGYEPIVINGITYYTYSGVYYQFTPYGYAVVQPPVIPVIAQPTALENIQNSFTVNIPNTRGGYTAVTIKKSGNGFVGPQGEFYAQFPNVEQLKVMYASK